MPWIRAEVARLRLPVDGVLTGAESAERRASLTAERDGLALLFARKSIDLATFDRLAAPLDDALAALEDTERVAAVSPIRPEEWGTWTPADLNAYLRSILEYVTMGADMLPIRAEWRNPALRAP